MKQDIRNIIGEIEPSHKELPTSHRAEFLGKLQASNRQKSKLVNFMVIFKIAAAIVLFVSVGYFTFNGLFKSDALLVETKIELQLKDIETQYLEHIDTEWQKFVALTSDEKLVNRYEQKLNELNVDYQEISKEFRQNKNNIIFIEALVENLKTRLQLLKDIQDHINLLNQKTKSYETIIL